MINRKLDTNEDKQPIKDTLPHEQDCLLLTNQQITENKMRRLAGFYGSCCSRYFHCGSPSSKQSHPEISINHIPSHLLTDEAPLDIKVCPAKPMNEKNFAEQIAKSKVIEQKKKERQEKNKELKEKKIKKQRLAQLAQQAKKSLQKFKKAHDKPKNSWGHSLFTVSHPDQGANECEHPHERKQRAQISLKPIEERIKQYQEKQRNLQQKNEEKCKHKYQLTSKVDIQQNARRILIEKKKQQQNEKEKKTLIEAKIKAIQLNSLQNVKKCKKNTKINRQEDFIVDVPEYDDNQRKLNKKKQKKKQSIKEERKKEQGNKTTRLGLLRKSKNSKSVSAKKKTKQTEQKEQNINPNEEQRQFEKFYVWNVPIKKDDFLTIAEGKQNYSWAEMPKPKKKFREEVQEYLEVKFQKDMKQHTKNQKKEKFQKLVQEKKRQFLNKFQEQNQFDPASEIFWNEDEIYRPQNLHNHEYF